MSDAQTVRERPPIHERQRGYLLKPWEAARQHLREAYVRHLMRRVLVEVRDYGPQAEIFDAMFSTWGPPDNEYQLMNEALAELVKADLIAPRVCFIPDRQKAEQWLRDHPELPHSIEPCPEQLTPNPEAGDE